MLSLKCFNHLHDLIVVNTSGLVLKYFAEKFKMANPMDEGAWKDIVPNKDDENEKMFLYNISSEFVDQVIMFDTLLPPPGYKTQAPIDVGKDNDNDEEGGEGDEGEESSSDENDDEGNQESDVGENDDENEADEDNDSED